MWTTISSSMASIGGIGEFGSSFVTAYGISKAAVNWFTGLVFLLLLPRGGLDVGRRETWLILYSGLSTLLILSGLRLLCTLGKFLCLYPILYFHGGDMLTCNSHVQTDMGKVGARALGISEAPTTLDDCTTKSIAVVSHVMSHKDHFR